MLVLFRILSRWPLVCLHALGWLLGWLAYALSPTYRQRLRHNAALAGVSGAALRTSIGQAGMQLAELPRLWMGPPVPVQWVGAEQVQAALAEGQGILFLTPHLGCFEITAQAYAQRFGRAGQPITVLFRPPRKAWLRELVGMARAREGLHTAPTTLAGVKQLIKALKAGQCVGMLPDQVPGAGQGVWVPFFGQQAYTMTLAARLAQQTGAAVLVAWGERLPRGRGYAVHVAPLSQVLPEPLAADLQHAAAQMNRAMEALIRSAPQQYLWGYDRYKQPREDA